MAAAYLFLVSAKFHSLSDPLGDAILSKFFRVERGASVCVCVCVFEWLCACVLCECACECVNALCDDNSHTDDIL